jgi:adenosylcobinamide-GDP ribazoletransferase
MIFAIRFLEYGRPEGGTGHPLFSAPLPAASFAGMLLPVAASFFAGALAIRLNLAFVLFTAAVILFYRRRIGCITGDMLGALVEATEVFLFLVLAAGGGR